MENIEEAGIEVLKDSFKTNGHLYKLYMRNDNVAVYSQHCLDDGDIVGYELTEIIIRPRENIGGVWYNKRECYCPTSQWGVKGFTLMKGSSKEYIEKRFKEMTDNIKHGKG